MISQSHCRSGSRGIGAPSTEHERDENVPTLSMDVMFGPNSRANLFSAAAIDSVEDRDLTVTIREDSIGTRRHSRQTDNARDKQPSSAQTADNCAVAELERPRLQQYLYNILASLVSLAAATTGRAQSACSSTVVNSQCACQSAAD